MNPLDPGDHLRAMAVNIGGSSSKASTFADGYNRNSRQEFKNFS